MYVDIKQSQNNITLTYVVATTVTSADLNDSIKITLHRKPFNKMLNNERLNNKLCKFTHSHYCNSQVTYNLLCL